MRASQMRKRSYRSPLQGEVSSDGGEIRDASRRGRIILLALAFLVRSTTP